MGTLRRVASPVPQSFISSVLQSFRCSSALLLAALLSIWAAPRAESAEGAPAPVPGYGLALDRADHLYSYGRPVRARIVAPAGEPGGTAPLLRLQARDAWGAQLWTVPAPAGANLTLDLAGRRWLELRLLPAEPGATALDPLARCTLAVLPAALPQDPRFGFNTRPELATVVRRLGGTWVRNHVPWEQGAAEQPLKADAMRRLVAITRAGGCRVFGISSYSLPWAAVTAPDDKRPMNGFFSVPRPEPWDRYVAFVARELRSGAVPFFEVWNEPNYDHFWRSVPHTEEQVLDDYAALLKRSHALLKREAPEVLVTNGSIVTLQSGNHHRFLEGLLARGCGDAFDVLNIHYYRGSAGPEAPGPQGAAWDRRLEPFLEGFRAIQARHGLRKPVWMTEIGWSTVDPGWGHVSEFEQMCFVPQAHVLSFAHGVAGVLWFKLEGEPFGIWDETSGPKPAAAAYAQLVRALHGMRFRRELTAAGNEGVRAFLFTGGNGQVVVVAWAATGETSWTPPASWRPERVENALGEALPWAGRGALTVGPAPLYLQLPVQPD